MEPCVSISRRERDVRLQALYSRRDWARHNRPQWKLRLVGLHDKAPHQRDRHCLRNLWGPLRNRGAGGILQDCAPLSWRGFDDILLLQATSDSRFSQTKHQNGYERLSPICDQPAHRSARQLAFVFLLPCRSTIREYPMGGRIDTTMRRIQHPAVAGGLGPSQHGGG